MDKLFEIGLWGGGGGGCAGGGGVTGSTNSCWGLEKRERVEGRRTAE